MSQGEGRELKSADGIFPDDKEIDPVVETPVLNAMSSVDAPLPNDFCQCFIDRVRMNVRQRRTESAVAQRIAQNVSMPITDSFEREMSDRVQNRVKNVVER
jgi:hypothetical protein